MKKPNESTKGVYLTTKEAAAFIGVHPNTLAKWRSQKAPGQPRHTEPKPRFIRYLKTDLQDWLSQ